MYVTYVSCYMTPAKRQVLQTIPICLCYIECIKFSAGTVHDAVALFPLPFTLAFLDSLLVEM